MRYTLVLAIALLAAVPAYGQDTPAARRAYTERACKDAVADKLTSPSTMTWGPEVFKADANTGAFLLRGTATSSNAFGTPITHRFICVVDPKTGRANAIFRATNPALYEEMVRLFGLG